MAPPLPDNVKEILNSLTAPQQVIMRSYIATLRAEIKDLNEQLLNTTTEDPHAHYHGHEKCTADHGHAEHGHEETGSPDHDHKHHEHHGDKEHKHEHHEHGHCDHESHKHEDHKHHDHDEHKHGHHDHHEKSHDDEHHHSHKQEHHGHEHEHGHGDSKKDAKEEMPAWKKKALEADPNAAPFGGSWTAESNISASDKMED